MERKARIKATNDKLAAEAEAKKKAEAEAAAKKKAEEEAAAAAMLAVKNSISVTPVHADRRGASVQKRTC